MSRTWWKSVDRWTEGSRMPARMWPRYRWGGGLIVSFHAPWGLWFLWAGWRSDGWFRWGYVLLLMLVVLSGWWRWRLDVVAHR